MKALVFLLVLANVLFYAFSAGYFGHADNPDAERIAQQVAPEKMRLVSRGEAPAIKVVEPPVVAAPAEVESASPAAAPAVEASSPPAVVEKICLRWDHLSMADAGKLSSKLNEKFPDFKLSKKTVAGDGSGWWVYIPPLPGKEEAEKKAGELRQLGVTDYFIVQESGPNRFAISLGVFSSEKGGQDRLAELKGRGVRSARLNVRPGKDSFVTLDAHGPAPEKKAVLDAVGTVLPKASNVDCK
ncbi:MAG: SPOR domain-containing protein [Rhodocyclales bacterium GT-UBC]|nr:MAG: SPOR domain-containing protein [Rhodocyclales bacterium GT-UBC]